MAVDVLVDYFPEHFSGVDVHARSTRLTVIGVSCLVSVLMFWGTWVLSLPISAFRKLRTKEKVFWAATVVRALYGVWTIIFAVWYLLFDDNLHIDIALETDVSSYLLSYVNLGFFVFELSCLLLSNAAFLTFDFALFLHHFLGFWMFFFIVFYNVGHYVGIVGAMLEMTTPFTCACWLLLKAGKGNSIVWKINQLILIHLFHCRQMFGFFWFYQLFKHWNSIMTHIPVLLLIDVLVGLVAVTFYLTPYWTWRKTVQLYDQKDWNHPDAIQNKNKKAD